jgi:hypothetical protein
MTEAAQSARISQLEEAIAVAREILMSDPAPTQGTQEAVDELEKGLWQYSPSALLVDPQAGTEGNRS